MLTNDDLIKKPYRKVKKFLFKLMGRMWQLHS